MCCIFTCCGWMIDLIQRLWTFTMSCCISSAVCCSFITACMAGIALGYNYSLAEYIDLKETNVSVYLKRGIFDDDIADDMDWRRRKNPVHGQLRANDLITAASEEESNTLPSGRRKLDDSIYESERHQNFEGSLMKLTAKPPFNPHLTVEPTMNPQMVEQISDFGKGSLNQMKAIQSLINERKMMADTQVNARKHSGQGLDTNHNDINDNLPPIPVQEERVPYFPGHKDPTNPGRRIMVDEMTSTTINSLRLAVPDQHFNDPDVWSAPKKYQEEWRNSDSPYYSMNTPSYPPPVTLRTGPLPPVRTKLTTKLNEPFIYSKDLIEEKQDLLDKNYRPFQRDMLLSDINDTPFRLNKNQEYVNKMKFDSKGNKEEEDYDDNFRGLPRRKKRSTHSSTASTFSTVSIVIEENKTENSSKSIVIDKLDSNLNATKIMASLNFQNNKVNLSMNPIVIIKDLGYRDHSQYYVNGDAVTNKRNIANKDDNLELNIFNSSKLKNQQPQIRFRRVTLNDKPEHGSILIGKLISNMYSVKTSG